MKSKSNKFKALQVEEYDEDSKEVSHDSEFSLVAKKVQHIWRKRKNKLHDKESEYFKYTRYDKEVEKKFIFYEYKKPEHFKHECPRKTQKDLGT